MPQLPAPKPKASSSSSTAAARKSTRASTASTRAPSVSGERETRRRSIMRNLRRSKKIVFSPEAETVGGESVAVANFNAAANAAANAASPVFTRVADRRRASVAALPSSSNAFPFPAATNVDRDGRRATVMMTPIQKFAEWKKGSTTSMVVTPSPASSSKSASAAKTVAVGHSSTTETTEGQSTTSKTARNLNIKFQAAVAAAADPPAAPHAETVPVAAATAAADIASSDSPETLSIPLTVAKNSPVVVLKRLSSEVIKSFTSRPAAMTAAPTPAMMTATPSTPAATPSTPAAMTATPSTPAWEISRRLLTNCPVVVLSPLVRHLRPAVVAEMSSSPSLDNLEASFNSFQLDDSMDPDDARTRVLEVCGQSTELAFYDVYPQSRMAAMKKIGEGTYGEVYLSFDDATRQPVVLKVIPIEGPDLVNGERQKTYAEMLSEAVITKEMSELSSESSSENRTSGFIRVDNIYVFRGSYPPELLKKWDEWSKKNESQNDRPSFYPEDQLFLVFEFSEGGSDLEKMRFACPLDVMSVLRQTLLALAVGEAELEFEHRDLHWGNVLIRKLESPQTVVNVLKGAEYEETTNVRVSIIDFTLSRLKRCGLTQFTDLAEDPDIFKGPGEGAGAKEIGDYQFDCYRLMQRETNDEWKSHSPRTNVIWLHYLVKKLLEKMGRMTKKQRGTTNWKDVFDKLSTLKRELLNYPTVADALRGLRSSLD